MKLNAQRPGDIGAASLLQLCMTSLIATLQLWPLLNSRRLLTTTKPLPAAERDRILGFDGLVSSLTQAVFVPQTVELLRFLCEHQSASKRLSSCSARVSQVIVRCYETLLFDHTEQTVPALMQADGVRVIMVSCVFGEQAVDRHPSAAVSVLS